MHDDLLGANRAYADGFTLGHLPARAARGLAIVTCMDSRIDPLAVLGLRPGEAKIVRNAGGRATPDALRSLAIAAAMLGVQTVVVMHHTECAMTHATNDQIREAVAGAGAREAGGVDFLAIDDARAALQADVDAVRESGLMPPGVTVEGWTYDVRTGRVEQTI